MAGLLDFLQGGDNQLGLELLAAGAPTTDPTQANFGYRLANAVGQAQARKDGAADRLLRNSFTQSQIDENKSQAEQRKQATALAAQKQAMQAWFLTGQGPVSAGGGAAAPTAPAGAPFGGMTAADISRKFGIPIEQVISDFMTNDGKKIADYINDRSKPQRQEINGRVYDLNGGFSQGQELPGYRQGKEDAWRLGATGETVTIDQPDGSKKTFLKSAFGPGGPGGASLPPSPVSGPAIGQPPVTAPPGRTPDGYVTRMGGPYGNVGLNGQPPYQQSTMTPEQIRIFQAQLSDPNLSAEDRAGVQRELARVGGGAPAAGTPSIGRVPVVAPPVAAPAVAPVLATTDGSIGRTPTTAEKNASEVQLVRDKKTAENEADAKNLPNKVAEVGQTEQARKEAAQKVKDDAAAPAKRQALEASLQKANNIVTDTRDAIKRVSGGNTGLVGAVIGRVPGTSAYDLRTHVDQIKNVLGLEALADLKRLSSTGASGLGATSDRELTALQSQIASLDTRQSDGQLKAKLQRVVDQYEVVQKTLRASLEQPSGKPVPDTSPAPAAGGSRSVEDLLKKYGGK